MTSPEDVAKAKALLESSQRLRGDLMEAVGKLDSYIEQLRKAVPGGEGRDAAQQHS